jgi:uncharacterized protein (TIGR03083 family)
MEVTELVDALDEQGGLLAKAASGADLELRVPTCPDWNLRDLLRHIGDVHRWARTYVAEAKQEPLSDVEETILFETVPADERIVEWFRDGHMALCDALRDAPENLECWSFLPAPSPLAFWARRQAHETAIHRADAEQVSGALSPYDPELAADGVDELLTCFAVRGRKLLSDPPRTMTVEATDTGHNWFVTLGTEKVTTERTAAEAECTVRGTASDLYLTLWNRLHPSVLQTDGDASVLGDFCDRFHIRWS